jgi:pimeloyl-ACP methyl ester carboxylesterase
MSTFVSSDGTTIGYERSGDGPPVILVDGALCWRESGPARPLAQRLAPDFTVYVYDRRGRGESRNTTPYSVEREVDDLAGLIKEAGGSACVYGISSGAALVLEAASRGIPVTKVAAYETPIVTGGREPLAADYVPRLTEYLAAGRRGKAVKHFMRNAIAVPAPFVALMSVSPAWPKLKRVAHTLPYDHELLGDTVGGHESPVPRWSTSQVPTLVLDGAKSPEWMRTSQRQIAEAIPGARYRTIPGQTHMLKPDAIAPILREFFRD